MEYPQKLKKMKNNIILFWGGILSNFYPSPIIIDNTTYNTVEQYFMAMKALHFNDKEMYELIIKSKTPQDAKQLGRKVKNFDADEWSEVSRDYMYKGNYAKYSQHPNLKVELLITGDAELAEASPYDKIWGIGLSSNDLRAYDKQKWLGTNWLGEILMKVRKELR